MIFFGEGLDGLSSFWYNTHMKKIELTPEQKDALGSSIDDALASYTMAYKALEITYNQDCRYREQEGLEPISWEDWRPDDDYVAGEQVILWALEDLSEMN